jgi:hypothetical protein
MSDDIVTRLRNALDFFKSDPQPVLLADAADEIERLRAELEHLSQSKSVNLYEESLALTLTDIATWDDLQEGGAG